MIDFLSTFARAKSQEPQAAQAPLFRAVRIAALLLVACAPGFAAPPDEQRLEAFLDRLGLNELHTLQLEKMLAAEVADRRERVDLAKRLADLYAAQLMNAADDVQKYDEVLGKIKLLTGRVPEAQTASLGVILLQADYNRAENLMSKWFADPKNTQAREEAQRILIEITPSLMSRRKELTTQSEALIKELDELDDDDPRFEAKEKTLGRLQAVGGRASYFAAWSNYYLGLLRGEGAEESKTAREIFRQVLGIEEEDYSKAEAEWLALESIWRSRSLIGLGLAEAAVGNLTGSKACFDLLRHASVSPEIQDQAPYWYVRGLLNARKFSDALEYAKGEIASFTGRPTQGKVSLCVALVRAGYGQPDPTNPLQADIGKAGVAGLAKLGQQKAIGQLAKQYNISMENPTGFFLNWIKGRQLADQAREEMDKAKYQEAAEAMENALRAEDVQSNVRSAAHCRYELGWCYYQLGEYEKAGRNYERALVGLKAAKEASAPEAAWMAFVSYNRLAEKNRRFASTAVDVLRRLKEDFPEHRYAAKVDYFIAKLQRSGSPQQAKRDLMAVPESNPNFLAARFDLCVLLHQEWSKDKSNAAAAKELQSNVDDFMSRAKEPRRKLRALLMGADAAISVKPPDWNLAAQRVSAAQPFVSQVDESDRLAAEFHYRRLQLATHRNDAAARRDAADWLVANATSSPFALPALVIVARALESQLKSADTSNQAAIKTQLVDAYRRLSNRYGTGPETLKKDKNARVAASRLARYQLESGRPSDSAALLEKLLAAFPADSNYLRRAGLAEFQAGNFEKSLGHWRRLVKGLKRGKPEWCEAKYYQIASLAKSDREAAAKSLKQFRLLYPNYGDPSLRPQFEKLSRELGVK